MKKLRDIELELSRLGIRNRIWGKPEVKELANILQDDETITTAANGRYQGGLALIVTTNHRLLLVDKKMMFMNIEDVRFDMITEVDYSARLMNATICVRTINKDLRFTSFNPKNLRDLARNLQARIMELRQMMMQQAQATNQAMDQSAAPIPLQYVPVQSLASMPHTQALSPQPQPTQPQFDYQAQPTESVAPQPPQPAPTINSTVNYSRPSRLRRVGTLPTASFTMQQRYSR